MKSSSIKKLRKLLENEVEQAESIIAARGFSQELQSMIEKLGRLINEDLPAVAEQMRMSLGADTATAFENQTVEVIQGVMDQLRNGKQDIDNSVAAIGEGRPIDSTPAFDDESDLDDELPSEDLLDLDADGEEELDLGGEEELDLGDEEELDLGDEEELPLGRAKKESIEYPEELSEQHKDERLDELSLDLIGRASNKSIANTGQALGAWRKNLQSKGEYDKLEADPMGPEARFHAARSEKFRKAWLAAKDRDHDKEFAAGQAKRMSPAAMRKMKQMQGMNEAMNFNQKELEAGNIKVVKDISGHFHLVNKSGGSIGPFFSEQEVKDAISKIRNNTYEATELDEGAVDKNYEDMARYVRAYKKARGDGERSFTVNGKTYKLVGDKEELEEMDRKCEAFLAKHHKLEESPAQDSQLEEFYDYFMSFYGEGGLYDFGATKEEIDQALEIRKNTPIYKDVPFEGDTVDREIIRDIILDEIRGEK